MSPFIPVLIRNYFAPELIETTIFSGMFFGDVANICLKSLCNLLFEFISIFPENNLQILIDIPAFLKSTGVWFLHQP